MSDKTSMQILIDWMNDQYYPAMYEDAIERAEQLRDNEEKQMIMQSYSDGIGNGELQMDEEKYYESTYGNNNEK